MDLPDKIKHLRENQNLSLQQLADKIEISKSVLWQYETRKSTPSTESIKKIALYFNVTTDYLIFTDDERPEMIKSSDEKLTKKLLEVYKMNPSDTKYIEYSIDLIMKKTK